MAPAVFFSWLQWRAAPCLDFPGPQNSRQIRDHPPEVESHRISFGFGQRGGGGTTMCTGSSEIRGPNNSEYDKKRSSWIFGGFSLSRQFLNRFRKDWFQLRSSCLWKTDRVKCHSFVTFSDQMLWLLHGPGPNLGENKGAFASNYVSLLIYFAQRLLIKLEERIWAAFLCLLYRERLVFNMEFAAEMAYVF